MKRGDSLYNVKTKGGLFNLKINPQVRDEFKLAAELRGATMSSLIHQFIFSVIREEKKQHPEAFAEIKDKTVKGHDVAPDRSDVEHEANLSTRLAEIDNAARRLLAQSEGAHISMEQVTAAIVQGLEAASGKLFKSPGANKDLHEALDKMMQEIPVPTEPLPVESIQEGIIRGQARSNRRGEKE